MATVTTFPMDQKYSQALSTRAVILSLELRKPGLRRKVSTSQITTDADPDMVFVSKEILQSPEVEEIETHDGQIGRYVRGITMPSPFKRGMFMLPTQLLEKVDNQLTLFSEKREMLVRRAVQMYGSRKALAPAQLGSLYNALDYPSESDFERSFSMRSQYLTFDSPRMVEEVRADIRAREEAKLESEFAGYRNLWSSVLAEGMQKLVDHLVDVLTPEPDGSKKTFKNSTLTNLYEFLETAKARNLGDNQELNRLVDRARLLLADGQLDPKELRTNDAIRDLVRRGFESVAEKLDGMTETLRSRAISRDVEK